MPAERLIISSDCGMGREGMGRRHAAYKMVSMVLGTNIVRKELGLPEARCLAAEGRYSLTVSKPEGQKPRCGKARTDIGRTEALALWCVVAFPPQDSKRRQSRISRSECQDRRAVLTRQRDRSACTHDFRQAFGALGPAGDRREQARHCRHRRRCQIAGRRPHADAHLERTYHHRAGQQEPSLRSRRRLCRCDSDRLDADHHDRAARYAGLLAEGIRRLREGAAEAAQFRIVRTWQAQHSSARNCSGRRPSSR